MELFFGGDSIGEPPPFEADKGETAAVDPLPLDRNLESLFEAVYPWFDQAERTCTGQSDPGLALERRPASR